MKRLLPAICLIASTCLAQSPGAKILVLERDQGEKRVRRPREKMPNPTSEFILKVTPQNSGSQHLVLGTETIPPGGVIPKHRHLGQDEILFLQTGTARVGLNDQGYEVHAGGMVFFPLNTWVSLRNTGATPIKLIFIFSAPGFDEYMRCTSVPEGEPASPIPLDELSKCVHQGHVEYEVLLSGARNGS
jgi:quercetin dioxygenase-like cupin family protein